MIPTRDRQTKPITIRMPLDVLEDLKRVAPMKGMSGYQPLIKFYVGRGLREDLELLWKKERADKLESALTEFGLSTEQKSKILDLLRDYPLSQSA
ncbi:hypothetical protein ACFL2Q_19820 [Thermodesulfobacteriota bacterium]